MAEPATAAQNFYLDSLFLQMDAVGQMFSSDNIWILVLMEEGLQGLQLVLGEDGAMPAGPTLNLVERLQLALGPTRILARPAKGVEEPHGPGEPCLC